MELLFQGVVMVITTTDTVDSLILMGPLFCKFRKLCSTYICLEIECMYSLREQDIVMNLHMQS